MGPDQPFLGSEVAASINASMLALMDANIPIRATVLATACAVLNRTNAPRERVLDPDSREEAFVVIDPSPQEEEDAESVHVFAFLISGYNPMNPPKSQIKAQLAFCTSKGLTDLQLRSQIIPIAEKSVIQILEHIRTSITQRFE